MTNIPSNSKKPTGVMDISPLLKEVYPKPSKKKTKSKRYDRIRRMLENR